MMEVVKKTVGRRFLRIGHLGVSEGIAPVASVRRGDRRCNLSILFRHDKSIGCEKEVGMLGISWIKQGCVPIVYRQMAE